MGDRFLDLKTFVAVVQGQGFNAAAERLGLAKSAVSRRITDFEDRLGTRLLNRTTRQMSLTDAGSELYWRSVRILADLEQAEDAATTRLGEASGCLRVTAPVCFVTNLLAPVLGELLRRHPKMAATVDASDSIQDIVAGSHDVAIRSGELSDSALISRRIGTVRYVLVASPAYLEAHGRPQSPADLNSYRAVVHSPGDQPRGWGLPELESLPPATMIFGDERAVLSAVIHGGGIALLPSYAVGPLVERSEAEVVLPGTGRTVPLNVVYPSARNIPTKVRVFVSFVAARFGGARMSHPAVREDAA